MTGTIHEDRYTFFISRSLLLILRNVSDKGYKENQSKRLVFNNFFFRISWNNVEKYGRAGQATDDNIAHAYCMLDTEDYKRTLSICNTYSFSTVSMVAWKRLGVTLYVHCMSCSLLATKVIKNKDNSYRTAVRQRIARSKLATVCAQFI